MRILRVRLFILGKPYVISVDDNLVLFPVESLYGGDLINDLLSKENKTVWLAILEKAFKKLKGNYWRL